MKTFEPVTFDARPWVVADSLAPPWLGVPEMTCDLVGGPSHGGKLEGVIPWPPTKKGVVLKLHGALYRFRDADPSKLDYVPDEADEPIIVGE